MKKGSGFRATKEGWLKKLGGVVKNWKKRYFMLTETAMSYYTKDPRPPAYGMFKGRVCIKDITFVSASEPGAKKKHLFLVGTTARTYEFQAGDDEERGEWIMAINMLLKGSPLERKASQKEVIAKRGKKQKKKSSSSLSDDGESLVDDDDDVDAEGSPNGKTAFPKSEVIENVPGESDYALDANASSSDFGLDGGDDEDGPPPTVPARRASSMLEDEVIEENDYVAPVPGGGSAVEAARNEVAREKEKRASMASMGSSGGGGSSSADDTAIKETLALTDEDFQVYLNLWIYNDGPATNSVAGKPALTFLQSSGLSNRLLRDIWQLSDASPPKGQLSRDELFTACKLVALKQHNRQPIAANLKMVVPTPVFATDDSDEDEEENPDEYVAAAGGKQPAEQLGDVVDDDESMMI